MSFREWRNRFVDELSGMYSREEAQSVFDLILSMGLGIGSTAYHLSMNENCTEREEGSLLDYLKRLLTGEPVQYIMGRSHFYGWEVEVAPGVLIPRQETEELVDWILRDWRGKGPVKAVDFGTGSGCIAVSLAKHLVDAEVWAVDVSMRALEIARRNAALQLVELHGVQADMLAMQPADCPQSVDVMVSNPPYVRRQEAGRMAANVLDFEPHLALFVEEADPLVFYRAVLRLAGSRLAPHGAVYFEINEAFGQEMTALCREMGFPHVELRKDLFGKDRMIKASY